MQQAGLLQFASIVCAWQIIVMAFMTEEHLQSESSSLTPEKALSKWLALSEVLNGAQPLILQNPFC